MKGRKDINECELISMNRGCASPFQSATVSNRHAHAGSRYDRGAAGDVIVVRSYAKHASVNAEVSGGRARAEKEKKFAALVARTSRAHAPRFSTSARSRSYTTIRLFSGSRLYLLLRSSDSFAPCLLFTSLLSVRHSEPFHIRLILFGGMQCTRSWTAMVRCCRNKL